MLVGQQVGPFAIDKELGSGAMGTVYRGVWIANGTRVAIKIVAPGLGGNERALARFQREADILKQVNHPNIVRLVGTGQYRGTPYYAMEYVEGEGLDRVLSRRGRFTWEEVVRLGQQLCAALQHAHGHGIIHRDLKPSNVMVLADGSLKLTDFGIAKDMDKEGLTSDNCTVGTASYMSPEQCRGDRDLTPRSDLYSLGVLFYELLTGRKPFIAESAMDMFLAHTQGTFERPSRLALDIPVWLDTLVCQLLEKKPEHRPLDAATVANAQGRVAEKVQAQRSAGLDAVTARVADRPPGAARPDDTDKEAARTLRTGAHKVRRKRKAVPWYRKVWVQAAAITVLLLGCVAFLYFALRPPGPDAIFGQAKRLMESNDPDAREQARNGPIKEYLRHYGGRQDEQARQVRLWADEFDAGEKEQRLDRLVRSSQNKTVIGVIPNSELEEEALRAALAEADGDLDKAHKGWREIRKKHAEDGPRAWLVLAKQRDDDLARAADLLTAVEKKLAQARQNRVAPNLTSEAEKRAAEAMRYERFGDPFKARVLWGVLRLAKDVERPWLLLAAGRFRALKPPESEQEEKKARLAKVEEHLARAREVRKTDSRLLEDVCKEVIDLYEKDADLARHVEEARRLLRER